MSSPIIASHVVVDFSKLQINLSTLNHIIRNEGGVATRWYDLGVELLDSNTAVLDVIKTSHQRDDHRCSDMFKTWLEMKPEANWSQLVTALHNIGLNTAARNLKIDKLFRKGNHVNQMHASDHVSMQYCL